ncbi:MAG TPA: hypothetical protein VHT91_28235 [Kofleriaceae bacterium]|nr:hypothetical protein [Kofleriaceae bacterium]
MTLGLTGGVAAADNYHHDARVEHYRDHRVRPAPRFERHDARRGYRWVGGEWRWGRGEWIWMPGHYIVIARW